MEEYVIVNVRLTKEQGDQLDFICKETQRTRADMVRFWIKKDWKEMQGNQQVAQVES